MELFGDGKYHASMDGRWWSTNDETECRAFADYWGLDTFEDLP